ncbi:MAG: sulfurtransferase TusA family protein [Candidatus Zixiibacteriota bacterium]|nr:sulfurtransferase TusA family protein [bacterium]RKX28563.1 MAG: sulfurtransferase TusA family protein [candidate division Zixibacteria bacterium]
MEVKIDETLDVKGLTCPMPIMKLAKAMKALESGKVLEMLGTDPGTKTDLQPWCNKTGNTLLDESELEGGVFRFVIKKK